MKQYLIIAAFFVMAAFLFSCNQHKRIDNDYGTIMTSTKSLRIELKGTIRSRRTYASIQGITDEKERDEYLTRQEKSNPELYDGTNKEDSILISQFISLGLIKGNEFLIKNFKLQTEDNCGLLLSASGKLQLKFYSDSVTGKIWFTAYYKNDTLQINTGANTLQNLDYAFIDVIPGGNKELVFLNDYYIMNGDNFDFQVYEIKITNPK